MKNTVQDFKEALRHDPHTGKLFWRYRKGSSPQWNARLAGKEAFTCVDGAGYKHGSLNKQCCLAHRVIWALETGSWPNG